MSVVELLASSKYVWLVHDFKDPPPKILKFRTCAASSRQ